MAPDIPSLISGLEEAFGEYCGPDRSGADVKEELEGFLEGEELERFRKDGHIPFIELKRIAFDRENETVLIDAGCLVDYNLDEHGISIKFADGKWNFGHGGEWDDEGAYEWDEEFLTKAFAEPTADHRHFFGKWENRTSQHHNTMEITAEKLLTTESVISKWLGISKPKEQEFRYDVLRCSPTHLMVNVFYAEDMPEEQIIELREDKLWYCDRDGSTPFDAWTPIS